MNIEIRPEQPTDFDAIERVVAEAFGSPAEALLVRRIRASDRYRPLMALVACVDDQVAGHVMISECELIGPTASWTVAMLSPLAVDPSLHRAGIGSELVGAACALADAAGDELVQLQGDPRYYGRFGFEPSVPLGITMDLPEWASPEAGQVLRLSSWTGELSGRIVLPPAFDGLD